MCPAKKDVLETLSKILQTYIWLSSYFISELLAWLLFNFCLFFDSAKEASNDVTTFWNLTFYHYTETSSFLRKYYMLMSSKSKSFH